MKQSTHEILNFYTPELPDLSQDLRTPTLANQLFLENCADRLTVQSSDGATRLKALEAVTMSLDGLTYRLTLKKGMYFHCGAEVTANDAVVSLLSVLRDHASISQLHRFVARDRQQGHGYAVYLISRYKFEIALTHRLQDLLARLALVEFSLRHEGRRCFSGLWQVSAAPHSEKIPLASTALNSLKLQVHQRHAEAHECQYREVLWRPLVAIPEYSGGADGDGFIGRALAEPYVYIYPGSQFKTPGEELLTDEICRQLDAGYSLMLRLEGLQTLTPFIKTAVLQATRSCFGKSAFWRRTALQALLPKDHVLHVPFSWDQPAVSLKASDLSLDLDVGDDEILPAPMWDKFRNILAEYCDLSARQSEPQLRATLQVVFHSHLADYHTPLSQLPEAAEEMYGTAVGQGHHHHHQVFATGNKPPRLAIDFCQHLARQHPYVPFLAVPFILRSNRNIRRRESSGLIHFADVRQSSDRLQKQRMKDATLKSLGAALQMFVHDVRRPFSMVQGILGLLEGAQTPERLQEVATKYLPEVKKSVGSVDRLVQDILEIGSEAEPVCEAVDLEPLIAGVLRDCFPLSAPRSLVFEYHLESTRQLYVEPRKLSRVLMNLVINAAEAMQMRGTIWFEAADEDDDSTMLFTVGNTNSFIPEEAIAGLFDRFFTEGKKQGTGLGLAIVKKIVTDHGGEVWCQSDREDGTRFMLRLPVAKAKYHFRNKEILPAHGGAIAPFVAESIAKPALTADGRTRRVLLVDDNPVYLEIVQELLTSSERHHAGVVFHIASQVETALAIVAAQAIDVAIVDVDLGADQVDGLELVRQLRSMRPTLKICVHSNGAPFTLQKRVLDAGGDLFLPKPMAREHLLSLLSSIAVTQSEIAEDVASLETRPAASELRRLAVIDDDALMLEMWSSQAGWEWLCFDSPAHFRQAWLKDATLLESLTAVITDFTFHESSETGLDLARQVADVMPSLPLFLATDRPLAVSEIPATVIGVLSKDVEQAVREVAQKITQTFGSKP